MGTARWVVAMLVGMVGISCGGGGSGPGSFLRDTVEAGCSKQFECCDATEIMEELGFFGITTEAECKSTLGAFAQIGVNQLNASIKAGRVVFHEDRASDCLELFAGMTCAEFAATGGGDQMLSGCEDPIEGLVAAGGACSSDDECAVGACVGDSDDPPMEGTCRALPVDGEVCEFDCAPGLFCDFGATDSTCAPQQANGASCGGDDECTSGFCDFTEETCAESTTCDGV